MGAYVKTISGTILETSPYELHNGGLTVIPEVRIEGADGSLYSVKNVGIDPRLSNAVKPGTCGSFTFHKTLFRRNILMAAEFNGRAELCSIPAFSSALRGIILFIAGIPLLPFLGFGLYFMALGLSFINYAIKINQLSDRLASGGATIQKFQVV